MCLKASKEGIQLVQQGDGVVTGLWWGLVVRNGLNPLPQASSVSAVAETMGYPLDLQVSQTVPSATAEEIQGLTINPENFLCRDHRKCFDSVHLSVVWKQLQPRLQGPAESCALS